jgi:peptidoglycan hydrolase-like protein with peptidoglycan-binding domain/N-acetylmuramoyl-L-alanine amidase
MSEHIAYIALDAGHSEDKWEESGGKGIVYGGKTFEEFWFNSAVCKYAKKLFEHNNFKIMLTQPLDDSLEVSLTDRTDRANEEGVDLFVSAHANASSSEDATGACAFYWYTSEGAKKLAEIWAKNAKQTPVGLHGRGLHVSKYNSWTNLHIVRETKMTAILIEHGFFTNIDHDLQYILSDKYRRECAKNIVKSVCEYYGVKFKDFDSKPKKEKHKDEPKKVDVEEKVKGIVIENDQLLENGDQGEDVEDLQEHLIKLGYNLSEYGADGHFGNETKSALKEFQRDHNLVVDGLVGKDTRAALKKSLEQFNKKNNNESENNNDGLIRKGDKGEEVEWVQERLITHGYSLHPYGVDGDFGSLTQEKVRQFQKDHGLIVDGLVGSQTKEALKETVYPFPGHLMMLKSPMMHGGNIKKAQQALKNNGADIAVDSWYGQQTANAIGDYQRKHGLKIDNILGENTWNTLF